MHSSDEESSEEEIINRNPTKTRSGRTSTPRYALNKDNFKTPNMTKTEEATPQGGSSTNNPSIGNVQMSERQSSTMLATLNRGPYNRRSNHKTYYRGRSIAKHRWNWNCNTGNRQNYQRKNHQQNYYKYQGNFNQYTQFTNKFLKGIFCFHCQREGHMARHCRSLNQGQRGHRGYHRGTNQQMRIGQKTGATHCTN